MRALRAALLGAAVLAADGAAAQEPAGPPPPASRVKDAGADSLELLPGLGRIGAQAGLGAGLSRNPYGVGTGIEAAGYLDVPLGRAGGGKLSYEIIVAFSHGESDPFLLTDPIAYVANLAAGAAPAAPWPGRRPRPSRWCGGCAPACGSSRCRPSP